MYQPEGRKIQSIMPLDDKRDIICRVPALRQSCSSKKTRAAANIPRVIVGHTVARLEAEAVFGAPEVALSSMLSKSVRLAYIAGLSDAGWRRQVQQAAAYKIRFPCGSSGDMAKIEALMDKKTLDALAPVPTGIETDHLSRTVFDKALVSDISVQVRPGEILAVVGPSGAGKSSFLRLLNRLDEPTGGTVRLNGQDYRELPAQELRRRIGMVMQSAYLFPGTVATNVAFGPQQRGERLTADEIAALLERVGLPGYDERDVSNLSGGEAQRVSLARTLANAPVALLLDEPTSALDEASSRAIEELLLGIVRERQTICAIVTHNTNQAHRIADRAMIIDKGRLISVGPAKEVLDAY